MTIKGTRIGDSEQSDEYQIGAKVVSKQAVHWDGACGRYKGGSSDTAKRLVLDQ
jgi:hypothetical protein